MAQILSRQSTYEIITALSLPSGRVWLYCLAWSQGNIGVFGGLVSQLLCFSRALCGFLEHTGVLKMSLMASCRGGGFIQLWATLKHMAGEAWFKGPLRCLNRRQNGARLVLYLYCYSGG